MIDASEAFYEIEALILRGIEQPSPVLVGWKLIPDLDTALQLATEQCLDGYEDWTNLRELKSSESVGRSYEVDGGSSAARAIFDLAAKFSVSGLNGHVENEIGADLESCALARAIESPAMDFFEQLVAAYASGYWPCGWQGAYPQGQLCVFQLRNAVRT